MATGQESPNSSQGVKQLKDDPEEDVREVTDSDCAVCLQPSVHPVKLPCGHIFCFLCVKGIALLSRKCAMCRQEIPLDCLEHPELLKAEDLFKAAQPGGGRYEWYYEGRNGWWQYDERTSGELESAFQRNEEEVEVLVAGFIYAIDLTNMTQRRKNGMGRVRAIKRDVAAIPDKKGVAGLRLPGAGDAALDDDSQPVPNADQPPHLSSGGTDEEPDLSAGSVAGASRESPRLPPRGDVDNDLDAHFGQLRLASTGSPPPPRNRRRGDNGDGVEGSGRN